MKRIKFKLEMFLSFILFKLWQRSYLIAVSFNKWYTITMLHAIKNSSLAHEDKMNRLISFKSPMRMMDTI